MTSTGCVGESGGESLEPSLELSGELTGSISESSVSVVSAAELWVMLSSSSSIADCFSHTEVSVSCEAQGTDWA